MSPVQVTYPSMFPRPRRGSVSASKLVIPSASTSVLTRPRLLDLLSADDSADVGDSCITVLCGPAGSGKTTLLAEWARQRSERAVAWVSLTSDDNDVFSLWSAILRALERSGAWSDDSPLQRLPAPRQHVDSGFLAPFMAAFERLGRPGVVLILDDLQEVVERDALATLDLLLRDCPPTLRLVLSTRFVPLLSVPKLRLEGKVREIGSPALGFSMREAADLLRLHDVTLADDDLRQLQQRTEGWAAGLRLAAMSLVAAPHREALIADLVRDDRAVADYLVGEVIDRQEPHLRHFLLTTSVPEEFTVDLARALSGRDDAGALLDQLERANALISRLGGSWYRYHPMLREYLRAELARQRPDALPHLHRTAADWFERHGRTLAAIEQAVDADDEALLVRLLSTYGLSHITKGQGARLRRTLRRIPVGRSLDGNPIVTLIQVAAALDAQDPQAAGKVLTRLPATVADDGPDQPDGGGVDGVPQDADVSAVARVGVVSQPLFLSVALQRARMASEPSAATALLGQDTFATGHPDLDLLIALERGAAWFWLGAPERAVEELHHALSLAVGRRRDWMTVQCLSLLAGAALAAGRFETAEARGTEALAFAAARGWTQRGVCTTAQLTLGWLAYQRVDDAAAELAEARLVVDAGPGHDPSPPTESQLLDALLRPRTDGAAYAVVRDIREVWNARWPGHVQPQLAAMALLAEQRLAYQAGATTWAVEVADRCRELLGDTGELQVLRAVNQAYRGRTRSAQQLLAPVLSGACGSTTVLTAVEAWLWEARLAHRAGERQRSDAAFAEAIGLAAPRAALRPLLGGGSEVAELLSRSSGTFGHHEEFAGRARTALEAYGTDGSAPLTARELQLLTALPSMRTADEIAASLYLSVNTVKTHLRGIYRKLGVRNRREAVVLARRRGLI